jgi:glutathione S-transferase
VEELTMNLYFAPLACSLATRIALYEAGAEAQYTCVDMKTKRLADGSDFFDINPMGQVVVLRTDDGVLLTENAAVLQYVADRFTVADAYLATILNWAASSGVKLDDWPSVSAYHQRILKRPSVAKAVGEEWAMYQKEQKSRAKS